MAEGDKSWQVKALVKLVWIQRAVPSACQHFGPGENLFPLGAESCCGKAAPRARDRH